MKKMSKKIISLLLAAMIVFGSVAVGVAEIDFAEIFTTKAEAAETYTSGNFSYYVDNNGAVVSKVDSNIEGVLSIPAKLGGYPVYGINISGFYGCTGITELILPEGLNWIGAHAFYKCTSLTTVTFPDSLVSIGMTAFAGCINLLNVEFGENSQMETFQSGAFEKCQGLQSVTIPSKVKDIGDSFTKCTSLKTVNYNAVNAEEDRSVESLSFFYGCSNLTTLNIGDSVESIPNRAFYCCSKLTNINFGENSQLKYIGIGAFYGCGSLTSIDIPQSVTEIADYGIYNCNKLVNVNFAENSQLKTIGIFAFGSSDELTAVTIPQNVTKIGNYAFAYCPKLSTVNYNAINCYTMGSKDATVFEESPNISTVIISDCVESIPEYAFYGCSGIKEFTMPVSTDLYSKTAYYNCSNIEKVTLTKGTGVMCNFYNSNYKYTPWYISKDNIKEIIIEDGVKNIGAYAFYENPNLKKIEILESVTSIGSYAFYNCTSLSSIKLPDSVIRIGGGAFNGTAYYADENNWENEVLYIGNHLIEARSTINDSYQIKNGTLDIASYAFSECDNLTKVTITDSVKHISSYAFYKCPNLKEATIPCNVESIDSYAFYNCINLATVNYNAINCSANCFYDGAFAYCSSLETVKIGNNVKRIPDYLFYNITSLKNVVFEDESQLKAIEDGAFHSCSSLTSIEIPDSVTSIGNGAFDICTSLTSVTFSENSMLTSIDDYAFSECSNLSGIKLPDSMIKIGYNAFNKTAYHTDENNWENEVLYIGNHLIDARATISDSYQVKNGTLDIAEYAFDNCDNLKNIVICQSVEYIGVGAFSALGSLENVTILNGVKIIDRDAFYKCESLKFIHIPVSVESIDSAFRNCTKLKYICSTDEDCYAKTYSEENGYNFIVCSGQPNEIKIDSFPKKNEYYVGDTLDTTGLVIKLFYCENVVDFVSDGFTCSPTKLSTSGTQKITVTYGGKTCTFNVTVKAVELTGIEVKTLPTKTTYFVGDTLKTTGLTLTAIYNNGTTKTFTGGYTYTPKTLSKAGTQAITVLYSGKTCTFDVTVKPVELSEIEVATLPEKTEYFVGDSLNTTGITLTAIYNNGKTETITSGFTCTPTALNTVGTQTITVTYGGKTCSFNVTVKAVELTGVSVKTNPTKTTYFVGDTLDTTGLTLTATYNNGTTETITSGFTCSPTKFDTAGTQTITVTYGGKTCTFKATVKAVVIEKIEIKTNPTKTEYFVGDTLDTTGLTLTATYNNGTTQTITSGFTCTPTTLNTAGTQKITVTYGGKTCTFNVTVKAIEVTSLEIKTNPTKTEYFVGDSLDTTGLTLTATYNNGTTETITIGFTCSPTYLSKSGTQTITVSYGGKTCTFDVTVKAVELEKIEVKTNPTKTEYFVGETLNTTGLVLLATYNNGTTRDITSDYTCTPTKLETAGEQTIKVSYYGKTCEFKVTVKPVELVKIEVAEEPTKTTYYVGETLDTTGLLLTLYYSDGSTSGATSGYTCTPTKLNTVGTQVITVEYGGFTDTFYVEVIEKPEETTVPTTTRPGTTDPTDPEDPTDPWEPSTTDPDDGNGGNGGSGSGGDGGDDGEGGGTGEPTTVPSTTKPNGGGNGGSGDDGNGGNGGNGGDGDGTGSEEPNPDGTYDVYFIVDGEIYAHYMLLPGNPVPVPGVNPSIDGLIFLGWTPAIALTMPEHDLTYYASFHGHSYTYTVTDEPDCENHGSAIYTCSCGKSYTVTVPALGHEWGAWTVVVEATATSNGLEKRVCSRCGKEEYRDISAPEANFYVLDIEDQEYTGYPLYPAVKVYSLDGERLDECYGDSPDENGYTVDYVNNTDAGVATVTVTGIGEYYGVIKKTFNIVRKDISDLDHAEIPDITDNGGESTPDPVITDNGRVLEKDKDYVLEYENNGGAGQARIIVTGIGNYKGTLIIVFNIVVNNTSFSIPVIGSQVYTGGEICPEFNLFDNGTVLKEGVHYTVEYADNINVGYGRIIITGIGNYSGTIIIIFRIVSIEITKATVPTLPDAESSADYTPDFESNPIIFNGEELEEGVDYRVVVRRNITAGYYEIIIIGIGNFTGTITIYVNIIGTDISKSFTVGRISDVMYQGVPVTPEVSVYSGGIMLERNVDYIVEYRNNNAVGTATVIIRGIGAYRGTITKTFLIYADNSYSIRISTSTYELKYEQSVRLSAEVTPESNRNFRVVWSSSDPSIAKVDENGKVTSCGEGNVTISATLYDEDGRVVTDPYGMEITDRISIKCTMTIWQKIIRFFRNLFSIFSFNAVLADAFKVR